MENEKERVIPFNKSVRIGNYKVWRSKKQIGNGKNKLTVEQLNICTLDDGWHIKIPATFGMFTMIMNLYHDNVRDDVLTYFFDNMMYVSVVPNGYFHRAITMVTTIYANPNILHEDDTDHESLTNNVSALIAGFLAWREEYDKHIEANEPTEEDIHHEEVAEEMMAELDTMESQSEEKESGTQ